MVWDWFFNKKNPTWFFCSDHIQTLSPIPSSSSLSTLKTPGINMRRNSESIRRISMNSKYSKLFLPQNTLKKHRLSFKKTKRCNFPPRYAFWQIYNFSSRQRSFQSPRSTRLRHFAVSSTTAASFLHENLFWGRGEHWVCRGYDSKRIEVFADKEFGTAAVQSARLESGGRGNHQKLYVWLELNVFVQRAEVFH